MNNRLSWFLFLLTVVSSVNAANRFWVGNTSANWSSTTSWSTSLGGAGGSAVPTTSDTVFFDGSDISSTGGIQTGTVTVSLTTASRVCGKLVVRNSASFIIIDGSGTRLLTVGNVTGSDLIVESGSTLNIGGSSNAGLTFSATSVSGTISGTLTVSSTGTLNFNSGTFTVESGGKVSCSSTATTPISNAANVTFGSGAVYEDNLNAAKIPTAIWDINSTVTLQGYTSSTTAPTGTSQLFGNVTWNCASQTVAVPINAALDVRGDFTVTTTNTGSIILTNTATSINMIVRKNFVMTAGTLNLGSSTGNGTISVRGNFTMNGGTLTETGTSTASGITFDTTITQTFTKTSGTIANTLFFTVASGAIVDFQSILDGSSGTFTNSGTMKITNDNGIVTSGASGQIQSTGTRTYNTTASYHYTGGSSQVFGAGLPATVVDLLVSNGQTGMALGAITINGVLTIASGSTVDMGTNALSGSSLTTSGTGTLKTQHTGLTPLPEGRTWSQTVEFNSSSAQSVVAGTYSSLTVSGGSTKTMTGNVTVSSALTLSSGKLGIGAPNTLTLNGNFTGGSASNTLIGSNTSNLSIGGSGAFSSSFFFEQSAASDSSINNLTLNRSGVTMPLGNNLKLVGTLTPTAGILATGGFLTLVSTASSTARIADGGCTSCSYISGNVKVQRFIPSVARRWRFLTSPVSGATLADWQSEIYITGTGTGFDPSLTNAASVYSYDESLTTGDINTGWTAATANTNTLTTGLGYRVFVRGTRDPGRLDGSITAQDAVTLDLNGAVNTGNVTIPVSFNASGVSANDGWNLVGNPFPSQIDWNAFHDGGRTVTTPPDYSSTGNYAHLDAIAYIFDAGTNSYVSYNAVSDAGTGTFSTGIIPSGAAFFVKTVATSPSMVLKESHKSASAGSSVFKTATPHFAVQFTQDSITSDEMKVIYNDQATETLDAYDIPKVYGGDVNIAAIGTDSTYQSVAVKPFTGDADTIGLSVGIRKSGTYTFTFRNVDDLLPGLTFGITLIDRFTSAAIDLHETTNYVFTADIGNPATFGNERFQIVIGQLDTPTTATREANPEANRKFVVAPTQVTDFAGIYCNRDIRGTAKLSIVDLTGKTIAVYDAQRWENNRLVVPMQNVPAGLYFIRVQNEQSANPVMLKCVKQ